MKKIRNIALLGLAGLSLAACEGAAPSSDEKQSAQQEVILQEGTAAVGMPNIKNFRERRIMKDIIEMRDQDGLTTYTYTFAEASGKMAFFCSSIGFPISAATQFTNPQKLDYASSYGVATLPQADPNGLFSPSSAEGTWVMCVDPTTGKPRPVYSEPKLFASPFPLTADTPK
jgi:hypothetical protein